MAVKRSFSVKHTRKCTCLACGAQILPDHLNDDITYTCRECGQEMTVDRYGDRVVLTVIERQELRRRIPPEVMGATPEQRGLIAEVMQRNAELQSQLNAANEKIDGLRQEAKKWQQAAEGLAYIVETMRAEAGTAGDTNEDAH